MGPEPPQISTLDRRLAWARLAEQMFGDGETPSSGEVEVELGGHRLLGVLGRGASATVYLARDLELEREVAIKLVEGGDRAATLREARALARVAHPSVVAVHRVGEAEGLVYIVMERLRGDDLRTWQVGRPWAEVVRMYVELARGLACAHEHGVVHRDFKPDNVRVDEHGRGRILDFGLAGPIAGPPSGGTPAYLAPEQLAGAAADPRMDQFAWAVALGEALSGERPRAGALPEPPSGPDSPPPRVWAVLGRALEAEPDRRWPTLHAAADALDRAAGFDAEQRGRALLLDRLEATWLAGVLRPIRRDRVGLRPAIVSRSGAAIELDALDRTLAHAGPIVALGGPGSGKTMALLELAELALARARRDPSALLPVVLNLSSWSTWPGDSLHAWLLDALRIEYGVTPALGRRWLDEEALLLLLDGLDEVARPRRAACAAAIARLRAEHLVGLAVACRSGEEASLREALPAALTVELQPLSATEVHAAIVREQPELAASLGRSAELEALLSTPLSVDLALRCADELERVDANRRDPDQLLAALLGRFVERQLEPLGSARGAELRDRLGRLARLLERRGLTELWVERMQPSWLERSWARVVHSLASVITVALVFALLVAATLVPAAGLRVGSSSAALVGPVLAAFVGVNVGLGRIEPVERLVWSRSKLRTSWPLALARALGLAAIVSAIATLAWGLAQPLEFVVAIALSNFVGYAVLFGLVLTVLAGLGAELVETRTRVNEGIRASARNTLVVWAALTLALLIPLLGVAAAAESLVVPELDGEAIAIWRAAPRRFFALIGLCAASTLGLVAGLLRGGFAVIQHAVLRTMLAIAGRVPLRLHRLLDAGCERGLLRRIGGGHAFIHAALQAELARAARR